MARGKYFYHCGRDLVMDIAASGVFNTCNNLTGNLALIPMPIQGFFTSLSVVVCCLSSPEMSDIYREGNQKCHLEWDPSRWVLVRNFIAASQLCTTVIQ